MLALEISTVAVLLLWLYVFIVLRWRRGFYLLMVYLPFAGLVSLLLNLWQPSLLFKDLFFVFPIYIAFAGELVLHKDVIGGFPRTIVYLMLCLAILTVIQTMNVGVANHMMALIGLKVWLFYLPLSLVAYAYADSRTKVLRLCHLLVLLSFMPGAVALVQVAGVHALGYRAVMEISYGDIASQTTQGFGYSQFGTALFGRIPSVFTFATQFFGFSLSMLVPTYIVWRTDTSRRWRKIGGWAFITVTIATFLSGERASFLFTPLTIALIFLLDRGIAGLVEGIGAGVLTAWAILIAAFGISLGEMYGLVGNLFTHYATDVAYGGLVQAIQLAPLGMGTGTNTGAARYALADPDAFYGIENYYAKAVYELGLPGLLIVGGLFVAVVIAGFRIRSQMQSPMLHCWASALVGFFVIILFNSFKGWLVDVDPVNIYYWVFCGLLFKLRVFQTQELEWQAESPFRGLQAVP